MNQQQTFGQLARKIVIEVDHKGVQRVTSFDYMVASGKSQETMVMLALPQKRPTDTRMMVMQLMTTVTMHLQLLFSMMSPKEKPAVEGGADGGTQANSN